MSNEEKVKGLVDSHYKAMHMGWLLGDAREGEHISSEEFRWLVDEAGKDFLSHPDLALIDQSSFTSSETGKQLYSVIPLAKALKEIEDGH